MTFVYSHIHMVPRAPYIKIDERSARPSDGSLALNPLAKSPTITARPFRHVQAAPIQFVRFTL